MESFFRRRATTASVEDELGGTGDGEGSTFPLAGGGGGGGGSSVGGGGSSTGLSAVSPRRAAARALAASSSSADGGGLETSSSLNNNPFARAAAAVAAPFRKVARENSLEKSVSAPPPALQRGESGLALLGSPSSVAAFEVDGSKRGATTAATTTTTTNPAPTSSAAAAARNFEAAVMKKVDRAILPCFMVLTLVNYLDRTNLR